MTTLSLEQATRYKQIAKLLIKYGQRELLANLGWETESEDNSDAASGLADDLQKLGPIFIKAGQLLSTQADIFSPEVESELARLHDKATPFPIEQVEKIFEQDFGTSINKAFKQFDRKPLAAASLSQVHRAVLHSGKEVVVKVQRPDTREIVPLDLEILGQIAHLLDNKTEWKKKYRFEEKYNELKSSLLDELDFTKEARNLKTLGRNLIEYSLIVIPTPVDDYTSSRILTMDYIPGTNISLLSPSIKININTSLLAEQLFEAYLKQILIDGIWHMDPHPGNVYITHDYKKLALLDLGMVGHIPPEMRRLLLKLMIAISRGQGDHAAEVVDTMGRKGEDYDFRLLKDKISKQIADTHDLILSEMSFSRIFMKIASIASECDIALPPQFGALGKTILHLEQVGKSLDPNFSPTQAIRQNTEELLKKQLRKEFSFGANAYTFLELTEFVQKIPSTLTSIVNQIALGEHKIKLEVVDEKHLMEGFQKIANRITTGLVLAASIIGAALLMRVETPFKLFGYPGIAMVLFLIAIFGSAALLSFSYFYDETKKRK